MQLGEQTAALKAHLEAKPGAGAAPMAPPRGGVPNVLIFKVMGRTFAILGLRGEPFVILKCDPHLVDILKQQYAGIGHRSHLDRRFWISVSLDAGVPPGEVGRLADQSYDLVCAGLTRKQRAFLSAPRGLPNAPPDAR